MRVLRQNTDNPVKIGPFISSFDGTQPLTALDLQQSDLQIAINGGPFAATQQGDPPQHDVNGWYDFTFSENDVFETGELQLSVKVNGALSFWQTYFVLPAEVYDLLASEGGNIGAMLSDVITIQNGVHTIVGLRIGAGSIAKTFEIKDSIGTPISQAKVWASTDIQGNNVVAGTLFTDDFGKVTFWLDPGVYWVWRDHPKYQFNNPQQIVVTASN